MTNIIMNQGIQFENNYINPTQLSWSKILNTTQCSKCQQFNHGYNACKHINHVCAHCSGDHELKSCQIKNTITKCNNCGGSRRSTSNTCPIKQKYLIIPSKTNDLNKANALRINPESSYYSEAPNPTNNPWFNPIPHNTNPNPLPPPPVIITTISQIYLAPQDPPFYQPQQVFQSLTTLQIIPTIITQSIPISIIFNL